MYGGLAACAIKSLYIRSIRVMDGACGPLPHFSLFKEWDIGKGGERRRKGKRFELILPHLEYSGIGRAIWGSGRDGGRIVGEFGGSSTENICLIF